MILNKPGGPATRFFCAANQTYIHLPLSAQRLDVEVFHYTQVLLGIMPIDIAVTVIWRSYLLCNFQCLFGTIFAV